VELSKLTGSTIAVDTECTGLIPWGDPRRIEYEFGHGKNKWTEWRTVHPARPYAFSFCDREGNTTYVRWEVDPKTRRVIPGAHHQEMATFFANPEITKIGHNIGYDLRMLEMSGFTVRGTIYDTMILAHIATAGREMSYALKPLGKKYLDIDIDDEQDLKKATHRARLKAKKTGSASYGTNLTGGRDPVKADYWMAPHDVCERYAVQDAVRCILFWELWFDDIRTNGDKWDLFQREHKLFWVLKKMEDRGVRVYPRTVRMLKWYYTRYRERQLNTSLVLGGAGLNFKSVPQMTKKFYGERGHTPSFTEKGNWSLNGERLLELAHGIQAVDGTWIDPPDSLAKAVLEYNAAGQTIGSFLDVYERYWVKEGDVYVLHPNYRQTGTITGRLSCSDPNLMQVASATTGRRKADIQSRPREAFGPRPGYLWYLPDYCLHPDTLVETVWGPKKIFEIQPGEHVFTFRDRRIAVGAVTRVTSVKKLPAYRLTFDNGETVIASADHRWPTQQDFLDLHRKGRHGDYRRAVQEKTTEQLVVGERMVPFRTVGGIHAYTVDGALGYTHVARAVAAAVYGPCPLGHDVHHKDRNRRNNRPDNLEYKHSSLHRSEHSKVTYRTQDHTLRKARAQQAIRERRDYRGEKNPRWGTHITDVERAKQSARRKQWWIDHPEARTQLGARNRARVQNHKLVAKEFVGLQPMWAITVEPDHNYALSCGVLTCNSQIEVWLFASLSGEEKMLDALLSGRDFHSTIAEQVFGRNPDFHANHAYYRKCAKLIMFAKLYGGGTKKLASLLKMDLDSAKRFIERYEAELPGVKLFMERMITRATRDRYIKNPFGRAYEFDPTFAYKSVNYLIQGTAADVMKNAMVNVDEMLVSTPWPDTWMLMTIHDELAIEVPWALHSKRLMRDIVAAMQVDSKRLKVPIPLPVGMKIATRRWHRMREVEL